MSNPIVTLHPAGDAAAVERVEDAIESIASVDARVLEGLGGDGLLSFTATLESLGRRVDALRVTAASTVNRLSDPVFGADGLARSHGFRSGTELLEQVTGAASATIRRRIRVGALIEPRKSETGLPLPALFPAVGDAFTTGQLGVDTAEVIGKELATAAPRAVVDILEAAERVLVGEATGASLDDFVDRGVDGGGAQTRVPKSADLMRDQARAWRDALDADGIEPRAEQAKQRRDFWVARTARDGLHTVGGGVTSDVAATMLAIFDTILSPHTKPMFLPEGEAESAGVAVGSTSDTRTAGQKRADVLAAMARSLLASTEFSVPPAVLVTIDADTHTSRSGTGTITGVNTPVAASAIDQVQCDAGTQPVWFTQDGRIHALGVTGRFFTTQQRRAIAARDGDTCFDPNCHVPATATEAHHVVPDRYGGPTHVDNGVLLCWYHHGQADAGTLSITMIDGKPHIGNPPWHPRT